MSKKVKQLMCEEMARRFREVDGCLVVDPTRLDGITANTLRRHLAQADVNMALVKNSLAKRVLAELPLAPVCQLLDGCCALVWGGESVVDLAKLMVARAKETPGLLIKGAVMEGRALDAEAAAALSKLPSKAELKAALAAAALSPGRRLAAAILAGGARIASIVQTLIERLEKKEGQAASS